MPHRPYPCLCSSVDEVFVQGRKDRIVAHGEIEIGGIIGGEPEGRGQIADPCGKRGPEIGIGFNGEP